MPAFVRLFFVVCLLSACSSQTTQTTDNTPQTVNSIYCDSYFVYDMCAVDFDKNGEIDFMYFQDSDEIFMTNPYFPKENLPLKPLHRCVQPMDDGMIVASTRLLSIDEKTSAIETAQIKSRLLIAFIRAQGKMDTCEPRSEAITDATAPGDTFGEEEFEEF